jgi:hypothetical protein
MYTGGPGGTPQEVYKHGKSEKWSAQGPKVITRLPAEYGGQTKGFVWK